MQFTGTAVPVNCIGIGYAFLALRKVVEALGLVSGQPAALGLTDTVWLLMVVAVLVRVTPWPVGSGPSWSPIWSSLCWRWRVPWAWLRLPSMRQEG